MENPIKENRIICNTTFATRLLSFVESIQVADACSMDEKESLINVATKLLEYQCITATDSHEINYLKMVGVYEKFTKPLLTTEDGFIISKYDIRELYSCMKKPTKGEQVLHYPTLKMNKDGYIINENRLYFKNKENCINYIDMNTPIYSKQDLNDFNLGKSL